MNKWIYIGEKNNGNGRFACRECGVEIEMYQPTLKDLHENWHKTLADLMNKSGVYERSNA